MKRSRGTHVLRKIGLTGCMVLIGWLSPGMGSAASPKVDVCHRALNGSFNLINVAYQAVQAHRAHGDALPGEAVPGMPGYKFDDTCQEVRASLCPCDFSLAGLAAVGIDGRQTETISCFVFAEGTEIGAQTADYSLGAAAGAFTPWGQGMAPLHATRAIHRWVRSKT